MNNLRLHMTIYIPTITCISFVYIINNIYHVIFTSIDYPIGMGAGTGGRCYPDPPPFLNRGVRISLDPLF